MKKYVCYLLIILFVIAFAGCGSDKESSSISDSKKAEFVKPKNYAAVISVEINPSFYLYLDDEAKVLAAEPKNADAKELDFSAVIGLDLETAMHNLMMSICEKGMASVDSAVLVGVIEGEEKFVDVNLVEIVEDSCADAVAKETVNASMDSVLRVRLKEEFGCNCMDCLNWYELRYRTPPWEWKEAFDKYKAYWQSELEKADKNDPQYNSLVKVFEEMTLEKYIDDYSKRSYFVNHQANSGNVPHEEKVITDYKILEYVISPYSGEIDKRTEEFTAKEYFEKYPEDKDIMQGLEKAVKVQVEVYVNGELQDDYYGGWLYLCDGKWYGNNGMSWSFG